METEPKELEPADLIEVFNRVLSIETYNFNESSLSKIKTMLNQKGLDTNCSIDKAIEKGDVDILKAVLDHSTTKIESNILDMAEKTHNLEVIELVKNSASIIEEVPAYLWVIELVKKCYNSI